MRTTGAWADRYLSVLTRDLGWDAEIVDEDDIRIDTGRGAILIDNVANSDPEFLHMMAMYRLPYDVPESAVMSAALRTSGESKGAKVVPVDNGVIFSVEMLLAPPSCIPSRGQLVAVLPRAVHMLDHAVDKFHRDIELDGIDRATTEAHADAGDATDRD